MRLLCSGLLETLAHSLLCHLLHGGEVAGLRLRRASGGLVGGEPLELRLQEEPLVLVEGALSQGTKVTTLDREGI